MILGTEHMHKDFGGIEFPDQCYVHLTKSLHCLVTLVHLKISIKKVQLADIDNRSKLTVSRYIRNQHKILFKSFQYVLFQNILIDILSLCNIPYYHLYEYFKLIPDFISISNNKKCINRQPCHLWIHNNTIKL